MMPRQATLTTTGRAGSAAAAKKSLLLVSLVGLLGLCLLNFWTMSLRFGGPLAMSSSSASSSSSSAVRNHLESFQQQQQQQQSRVSLPSNPQITAPQNTAAAAKPCDSLCSCFYRAVTNDTSFLSFPSAAALWKRLVLPSWNHFEALDLGDNATLVEQQEIYRVFLKRLFYALTPHRLDRAWKSSPPMATIRAISQILERRFWHLHNNNNNNNKNNNNNSSNAPPLRIAVMGGSVTAGHDVERHNVDGLYIAKPEPSHTLAWPMRLEHLINQLAGFDAVQIWNMAISASTSDIGSMVLKYHLFPPEWKGASPDVVVWSFATNDKASTKLLGPSARQEQIQEFLTYAQELRCSNDLPMIVVMDDLVLHPGIMHQYQAFSADVNMLAEWNNVLGISARSALMDIALANPQESAFHSEWIHATSDAAFQAHGQEVQGWKQPGRIHPGLGVHIAISGIVMYQFIRLATDYCDAQLSGDDWRMDQVPPDSSLGNPLPKAPLPPYHSRLDSRNVLPLWKERASKFQQECASRQDGDARVRCSYAWVSNRMAQMGTKPKLKKWMDQILVGTPKGWQVNGIPVADPKSEDKVGWEAMEANATFAIEHTNHMPALPIEKITIVCMHSYGLKWKDSQLEVVVLKKKNSQQGSDENHKILLTTRDIFGFHKDRTSIYFPYELSLTTNETWIMPGETLRMEFRLVGGTTFKILGLTFCAD